MIRYSLLTVVVLYLCLYSFKDWYRALCYSIPFLALLERPDMPRAMLGIPGMNPYNLLLLFVLLGWLTQKNREGLRWQVPTTLNRLLWLYIIVVTISWLRMMLNPDGLFVHVDYFLSYGLSYHYPSITGLVRDDFFNAWKWLIPGLLICHGATTRERGHLAMQMVLLAGLLLGVQIIIKMAPALLGHEDLNERALRVFDRDIGYFKVQLATFTASCAWGFFVYANFMSSHKKRLLGYGGFSLMTVALMLTGGRGGAVAWAVCAMLFGMLKWRKMLFVLPVCIALAFVMVPGAENRYLAGVEPGNTHHRAEPENLRRTDAEGHDLYAMTSGRVIVWPYVVKKIIQSPVIGYGMRAYEREGVFISMHEDGIPFGIGFWSHPHNAFLMVLLDMGIVGGIIVFSFFWVIVRDSIRLFRQENGDEYTTLVAGFCLAFVVTALVSGMFACTLYPAQDNALEWCAIGLFMGTTGRKFGKQRLHTGREIG